jgi:hypothetical protein
VALLRLAPGAGKEFWDEWAWAVGDAGLADQARRAYEEASGAVEFGIIAFGPYMAGVLARLRGPDGQLREGPPARAESRRWEMLTHLPATGDEQYARNLDWATGARLDEVAAAWPLLCPGQPELIAAHLLGPTSAGLESGNPAARVALAAIASPGRPFGQVGHLAMVTGLASAEAGTRIAAAEAWARAAADHSLDPSLAAYAMVTGIRGYAFKLGRLADGLGHAAMNPVARSSVASAAVTAVGALLTGSAVAPAPVATPAPAAALAPAGRPPTGLHLLLEVATRAVAGAEGAVNLPAAEWLAPGLPASIAALAAGKASTKLAEAARRLTQLVRLQ